MTDATTTSVAGDKPRCSKRKHNLRCYRDEGHTGPHIGIGRSGKMAKWSRNDG